MLNLFCSCRMRTSSVPTEEGTKAALRTRSPHPMTMHEWGIREALSLNLKT